MGLSIVVLFVLVAISMAEDAKVDTKKTSQLVDGKRTSQQLTLTDQDRIFGVNAQIPYAGGNYGTGYDAYGNPNYQVGLYSAGPAPGYDPSYGNYQYLDTSYNLRYDPRYDPRYDTYGTRYNTVYDPYNSRYLNRYNLYDPYYTYQYNGQYISTLRPYDTYNQRPYYGLRFTRSADSDAAQQQPTL